jgi:hypothetical protein
MVTVHSNADEYLQDTNRASTFVNSVLSTDYCASSTRSSSSGVISDRPCCSLSRSIAVLVYWSLATANDITSRIISNCCCTNCWGNRLLPDSSSTSLLGCYKQLPRLLLIGANVSEVLVRCIRRTVRTVLETSQVQVVNFCSGVKSSTSESLV